VEERGVQWREEEGLIMKCPTTKFFSFAISPSSIMVKSGARQNHCRDEKVHIFTQVTGGCFGWGKTRPLARISFGEEQKGDDTMATVGNETLAYH